MKKEPADLLVYNARIWTADTARPWAEALAVRDGRFAAVGSNVEVFRLAGDGTREIDAGGRFVAPGFIDSHVHFLEGGLRLSSVQLRDAATREEFVGRIAAYASALPQGAWIIGGDWDHELWGGELPSREWIDKATPRNPVWVNRLDGHMALANSLALQAAGITGATRDPEGGAIVRDSRGNPTGVLKDNAMALVARVVPETSPEAADRALEAAMKFAAANGVTSVHHMGTWADLAVFERARQANRLRTRIYAAVPLSSWERMRDRVQQQGRGDSWLRWGLLKAFVDGSLGSHTAAFEAPYSDAPNQRGLLVTPPGQLREWIMAADKAGLHLAVHAIGDRANRVLLEIFEAAIQTNGPRDRRFRIEHAQHLQRDQVAQLTRLGVIASMQPYHAIDDGRWAEKVVGPERIRDMYLFATLLANGAHLAFGSDWYVAPPSVMMGVYAAVTRRTLDGKNPNGWVPEERVGVEAALRAYTIDAAYASFEEAEKGSVTPGKLADFVILERDPTRIPPEQIGDIRVDLTVVGGETVYQR
jgi:predicted amidohydrolase YtcJ